MRIRPLKTTPTIEFFSADPSTELQLPFLDQGVSAGFPSPAQDYMDLSLDLNKELIKHPLATFFGRVRGQSMRDAGVEDGDVLVIDKSLEPENGSLAVCFIDGEFTLKTIRIEKGEVYLVPANPDYQPIRVTAENEFMVWGIVTYVVKKMR